MLVKKPLLVESSLLVSLSLQFQKMQRALGKQPILADMRRLQEIDPLPLCPSWAIYRESKGKTVPLKIWKQIKSNLFEFGK